jgi:hypothetical protein
MTHAVSLLSSPDDAPDAANREFDIDCRYPRSIMESEIEARRSVLKTRDAREPAPAGLT